MRFYLGVPEPAWLARSGVPLFVSHTRLRRRARMPQATAPWALDSGGFTELQRHGRWTVSEQEYAAAVRRYRDEVGLLDWASPQDWMCEPAVLQGGAWNGMRFAGTGLSVREHQERTVENLLVLRQLAPDLPFIPVLQGFTLLDYRRCLRLYEQAGIDLRAEPTVGVGSVCRRESSDEIRTIMRTLHDEGLRLHGFGVKTRGLDKYAPLLASADSMAWSQGARRRGVWLETCREAQSHKGPDCRNCFAYAKHWRTQILAGVPDAGHASDKNEEAA